MNSRIEDDKIDLSQHNSIPEFTKNEIQDAIDRLKKGKAKDGNGIRAEQLKNCSDDTKEKSGQSSMKLCSRRTSHQNVGERSVSRSSTKKVTERTQAITCQFVACQFYTNCLPRFYMPDSHLLCTKYNLPTRQGFGPTIDVTTTLWGTEYWSNVVVSRVYRCTSARSTSRKNSTVSNIRRYGAPCSSTVSSQHTWDDCNGFTAIKKEQSWQTKKVMHFQSNEERNRETHCPPYCSIRCCNILGKTIWNDGKKNKKGIKLSEKTEDCLTNLRFADDVLLFSTSLERLREMLCEFKASTEAVGLGIHPDKTKILSNQDKAKVNEITVDNIKIEVLKKGDSARYLPQKITFEDQETEEIKNRLKAAWAAFHKYHQELTSRDYRLCHRLRLSAWSSHLHWPMPVEHGH